MSPRARFELALVTLLLEPARLYSLTLNLNRGSQDDVAQSGLREVMLNAVGEEATALGAGAPSSLQRDAWAQARVPTGHQEKGCCLKGLTDAAHGLVFRAVVLPALAAHVRKCLET